MSDDTPPASGNHCVASPGAARWCLCRTRSRPGSWVSIASSAPPGKCANPGEERAAPLLDTQQLVVLGDRARGAQRADLDLASRRADGDVGHEIVLGFARPRREDGRVACSLGLCDDLERSAERSILVSLDEHAVGDAFAYAARKPLRV